MSPVTNPDWWAYHKVWVGTFQWLVLPLPVFAWLCLTARCCLAIDIRDIVREAADDKKQCRPGNEQGEEVNHHENDDARCLFSSNKCEHTRSLRAAGAGDPDGSCATGWKNSGRSEASARKGGR